MTSKFGCWRASELGQATELRLAAGTLRHHDIGAGPTIVFVHGVVCNANLWRKLVARLASDYRCVALDLPLGGHCLPMPPNADLSPPALADLIADTIEALALKDVTLVGNDTGGALCQLVVAHRPERIARLALTSCDAFENFPPALVRWTMPLWAPPGAIWPLAQTFRSRAARRLMYATLAKSPIHPDALDSYVRPVIASAQIRRDARKVLRGLDKRHTLIAVEHLRQFRRPVLIAWSRQDRLFPAPYAERLAQLFDDARLEWIEDSRTFSPEDQPEHLARLIAALAQQPAPARV